MVISLSQSVARRSLALAQELAQPYSEGAMNSLVIISRYGGWDATSGEYDDGAPEIIYEDVDYPGIGGPAGITPTEGPITMNFGDEPEYYDSVNVYILKRAPILPMIDDVVLVTAGPDPQFTGRQYKITGVHGSGRLVPSIHIVAMGTAPSRTTQ